MKNKIHTNVRKFQEQFNLQRDKFKKKKLKDKMEMIKVIENPWLY
jgi:hypothetical protein